MLQSRDVILKDLTPVAPFNGLSEGHCLVMHWRFKPNNAGSSSSDRLAIFFSPVLSFFTFLSMSSTQFVSSACSKQIVNVAS